MSALLSTWLFISALTLGTVSALLPVLPPAPVIVSLPHHVLLATSDITATTYQIQFYTILLFGSGPCVSGFSALPQIIKDIEALRSLQGGRTLGGPTLELNPLEGALLPEPLRVADVVECIRTCPAPSELPTSKLVNPRAACAGSMEQLAQYVSKSSFTSTLTDQCGCNPLATECLFKALSGGTNAFTSVKDMNEKVDAYRSASDPIPLFQADLGRANGVKLGGVATLAILLGVVVEWIAISAEHGFFT